MRKLDEIAKYILSHSREHSLVPTDGEFGLAESLLGRTLTENEESHFVMTFGDLQIPD